ncbi:hypothetical protein ACIBK9_28290 [Nonomuraea sp. NPDC050227]|uniref:hypothetical protein n=1 Tax=Nonomuraea sp. NPDC050227 TaxID=3364360 RepID=UPI0037A6DB7B
MRRRAGRCSSNSGQDLHPYHEWEGPDLHATFQRSFALAKKLTGVAFSQSMLDMRFLAARIRNV